MQGSLFCAARGDEICLAGTARAQRVCRQTLFGQLAEMRFALQAPLARRNEFSLAGVFVYCTPSSR